MSAAHLRQRRPHVAFEDWQGHSPGDISAARRRQRQTQPPPPTPAKRIAGAGAGVVLIVMIVATWRHILHKPPETPLPASALPPHARQPAGRPANADDACAWRDPPAVLVLRTPKAASTTVVNAARRLSRDTRRFFVHALPEWPLAVGPVDDARPPAGSSDEEDSCRPMRGPRCSRSRAATFETATRRTVEHLAGMPDRRFLVAGHVFLPDARLRADVAVVGTARDPLQRLASGFYYTRRKKAGKQEPKRSVLTPHSLLGACAANATCARQEDLGRLCSFHALYYCGFSRECGLDPVTNVATDRTVDLALHNLNASADRVLAVVPVDRLDADGAFVLETLLPHYFHGFADAAKALDVVPSLLWGQQTSKPYDAFGARRSSPTHPAKDAASASSRWRVPENADDPERSALEALCRQDRRVYDFITARFDAQVATCRAGVLIS